MKKKVKTLSITIVAACAVTLGVVAFVNYSQSKAESSDSIQNSFSSTLDMLVNQGD